MPVAIAPLLAAAGVGIFGQIVIGVIVSVGLSILAQKIAGKPKSRDLSQALGEQQGRSSRVTMKRQPVAAHVRMYGEGRIGSFMNYSEATFNNSRLHIVACFAGHEVDDITTVYLNDEAIYVAEDLDANGHITVGKFKQVSGESQQVRIRIFKGTATQAADPDLVAESNIVDDNFRGQGIAYVYVRLVGGTFDGKPLFPSGVPNVSARVRGLKITDQRKPAGTAAAWSPNAVLAINDYLTDDLHGMKIPAADIETAYTADGATRSEEIVDTKDVVHQSIAVDVAKNLMELDGDTLAFQTGDRVSLTEVNSTAPMPLTVGTNYFVIVARERKSTARNCAIKFATTYQNAVDGNVIPLTDMGAAPITVTKDGEPRYTINGPIDTSRQHFDLLQDLRTAMAGDILNAGGAWRIQAGVFYPAGDDAKLTTTDMRKRPNVVSRHSLRDRFNTVQGVYFSPLQFDQPTDYPQVSNATFVADDLGRELIRKLDLPFTSRSQQAQRIARIHLRKHRQEILVNLFCNIGALAVQAGDTIEISDPDVGWVDKEFEILEWTFFQEQPGDPVRFVIDVRAQETASASYDFPTDEEQTVDPAPNTNLPSFDVLAAVQNLDITSGDDALFIQSDGTIHSGMLITWDPPSDGFLGSYNVEWRLSKESIFAGTTIRASAGSSLVVRPVIDGQTYIVRVRAVNTLGVPSDVVTKSHVVLGKSAKPSDVDVLIVQLAADGTRQFDIVHNDPPLDVVQGGGYQIRYSAGTSFLWETATALHTGLLKVFPYENTFLDAGVYTFGIKAIDSSGNESVNAVTATAVLGGTGLGGAALHSLEGERGWPGTKTNAFVTAPGVALLATGGVWTDMPATWAGATGSWDDAVGLGDNPVTYETETFDIGADDSVLFDNVFAVGDGTITVESRVNTEAEGADITGKSYAALPSTATTLRYVQFRVTVDGTGPSPSLRAKLLNFIITLTQA